MHNPTTLAKQTKVENRTTLTPQQNDINKNKTFIKTLHFKNQSTIFTTPFGDNVTLKTEPMRTQLKENTQPYAMHTAQRVPLPLMQKVKEELKQMEDNILE